MQPLKLVKSGALVVLRNQTLWGVGSLVVATVIGLMMAWIYVSPPWQKIVSFYTDDAATLRPGLQVRIAGISVGKVKDLSLESDQVRIRLLVDPEVFVGDQSQVSVRMLTVVGGYYVNIDSIGDAPIGGKLIPQERVTMPYSLIQTLSDTTKVTTRVKPKPINESLNLIQQGLEGRNLETVSAIIDAGNSLVSAIEKQRGQVTEILDVSNEYVHALTGYRAKLELIIRHVSIQMQQFSLYSEKFGEALYGLGELLLDLKPLADYYVSHRNQAIEKIRHYLNESQLFAARNGLTVRVVHRFQNLFNRVFDAQNAPAGLMATDLCIPVPGSVC